MSLDGSLGHFQLFCDLGVVAALQQQVGNLLLSFSQTHFAGGHYIPLNWIALGSQGAGLALVLGITNGAGWGRE